MRITYFFRKPSPNYHSIEKLFEAIIGNFASEMVYKHQATHISKGFINRVLIGLSARKNQGDINHITGDIHFIALFLAKNKSILTIHDIGIIKLGNFLKRYIIKLFWFSLPIKCVKYVTTISEFTKQELMSSFNIQDEKITVINNCIPDIYKYTPKTKTNSKPIILQIGTKANKNLENLIFSIEDIDCKLVIIGELSINQLEILKQHQIDFENHFNIEEEQMLQHFINCDILAYISTYEGFGMPVIEANAVGRPVLASDIEPIKTVASNAALLVNPNNVIEIRDGINKLLSNKELCSQLIENGLENAKKYLSTEISKQYMSLYKKMIEIR